MISTHPRLKAYCSEPLENIENYEQAVADKEHMWDCHHRAEILPCGIYSREALERVGMYWHRPASELIFLIADEHNRIHGSNLSIKTRRMMSESRKGRRLSEETKRRIAESQPMRKKVEMTRLADGYIGEFPSINEAERWLRQNGYPKADRSSIYACCNSRQHTAYDAKWRHANELV